MDTSPDDREYLQSYQKHTIGVDPAVGDSFNVVASPYLPAGTILIHQGNISPTPAITFSNDTDTGLYRIGSYQSRKRVLVKNVTTGQHVVGKWIEHPGIGIVVNGGVVSIPTSDEVLEKLEVPLKDYDKMFTTDGVYTMKSAKEEKLFTVKGWGPSTNDRVIIHTKEITNLEAIEIQANDKGI